MHVSLQYTLKKLRNSNRYNTLKNNRRTETSFETGNLPNVPRDNADPDSEAQILRQKEVDEKTKTYIAPFAKHLEDLTRLIQGISHVRRQHLFSTSKTSGNSSAYGPLPETMFILLSPICIVRIILHLVWITVQSTLFCKCRNVERTISIVRKSRSLQSICLNFSLLVSPPTGLAFLAA